MRRVWKWFGILLLVLNFFAVVYQFWRWGMDTQHFMPMSFAVLLINGSVVAMILWAMGESSQSIR